MHEDFDDQYDDDPDDEYNYDHPSLNPYQWYYKFEVGPDTPLSKWINDIVNSFMESGEDHKIINIPGFPPKMFPVNSYFSNTAEGNTSLYLGNNYYNEKVWKKKYFIHDKLHTEYVQHLQTYARHFLSQPRYYKGLHEILN